MSNLKIIPIGKEDFKEIIDDNCDVWKNIFTSTTKEEGNEYFKYLLKHGFKRIS